MNIRTLLFTGISICAVILIIFLFLIFSFSKSAPTVTQPQISPGITGTVNQSKFGFQMVSSTPTNQGNGIQLNTGISAVFNKDIPDATVTFFPVTPFTSSSSGRTLIIKPTNSLSPSTRYIVTMQLADQTFFLTFTTIGPTPTIGQSTRPIDQINEENAALKAAHPDVYLSNYTPFANTAFSVTSAFVSGNPGHFQFTVTSKTPGQNVSSAFQTWAVQQGLNSSQVVALDVVYQ